MTDYDTFALFGAVYDNQEAAETDYEAVKSLYYDWELIDNFDAAVVAKHADGKVKIVKKHEQPTRKGGWRGAGIGLATGAVIALFPAAAIGSGLLAATTGTGAALGAVAGHVTHGDAHTAPELLLVGEESESQRAIGVVDVDQRVDVTAGPGIGPNPEESSASRSRSRSR